MTIKVPVMNSDTNHASSHDCDVAIVGAGPVGTLLAILLGHKGHRVTLVERWPQLYERPRAVTFDHEIARILATLGIDSDNDSAINYHDELYYWRNAAGEDLQIVDWKSTSASGWRVRYWFYQPDLEKRLLNIAATIPNVRLIRGWEANALTQNEEGIWLGGTSVDPDAPTGIQARYVVGADGANSFVRKPVESQADRGSRDAQSLDEGQFGEPLAGAELALQEQLPQGQKSTAGLRDELVVADVFGVVPHHILN